MELEAKQGFKQTEVGLIPEDWGVNYLGNVSFVTKLAGFEYTLHFNSYKDGGDIIVVRGTNITHNKMDLSDVKTIPATTSNKLLRSKLFKNDLVFAYVGTIGPIFLIDENDKYHLGPNTAKISVEKELDSKYLYHYFTSVFIENEIYETTSVGAQPSLSMTKIRSFKIVTPTLAEQKAIATALSDVDDLISSLNALIAKKKAIKQGAMQQLLTPPSKGGKRLDGFDGEWVEKKISDFCDVRDGTHDSPKYVDSGVKFVTSKNIIDNKLNYQNISFISQSDAKEVNKRSKVDKGDILMSMIGTIGSTVLIENEPDFCIKNVALFKPFSISIDVNFLFQKIISPSYQQFIIGKLDGGIQKFISLGMLRNLTITLPHQIKEQKAIAQILSDLDKELEELATKKEKYEHIKQGMMQELLTGKTRLI